MFAILQVRIWYFFALLILHYVYDFLHYCGGKKLPLNVYSSGVTIYSHNLLQYKNVAICIVDSDSTYCV